jgi:hypothetical protein
MSTRVYRQQTTWPMYAFLIKYLYIITPAMQIAGKSTLLGLLAYLACLPNLGHPGEYPDCSTMPSRPA